MRLRKHITGTCMGGSRSILESCPSQVASPCARAHAHIHSTWTGRKICIYIYIYVFGEVRDCCTYLLYYAAELITVSVHLHLPVHTISIRISLTVNLTSAFPRFLKRNSLKTSNMNHRTLVCSWAFPRDDLFNGEPTPWSIYHGLT